MKLKKIAAAFLAAAAALALAMPSIGAVPADSTDTQFSVEDLKAGDYFYVAFDPNTGDVISDPYDDIDKIAEIYGEEDAAAYDCQVLSDGTISIQTSCWNNVLVHSGKKITIPKTICGYTVTQIGHIDTAIARCIGGFSSVTIPDTVTAINKMVFYAIFTLEEVNFGENSQLKLIGQGAFSDCRSLKSITIPAGVETIEKYAFANFEIDGSGLGAYEDMADTYSLTTVKFAEGSKLKTIGDYAFQNQCSITDIELPNGLEEIGNEAFAGCTSLDSVTIPQSVNSISKTAFKESSLKNINGVAGSYAETFAKENGYTFNGIPFDDDPSGDDPSGDNPSGDNPSGDNPSDDDPSGDDPSGDDPSGDNPSDDDPSDDDPSGDDPSGDNPSDDDPSDDDPSGDDPSGNNPSGDTTSDTSNGDNGSSDSGSADKDNNNPDTGAESIALTAGLAVLAASAVAISRRRK